MLLTGYLIVHFMHTDFSLTSFLKPRTLPIKLGNPKIIKHLHTTFDKYSTATYPLLNQPPTPTPHYRVLTFTNFKYFYYNAQNSSKHSSFYVANQFSVFLKFSKLKLNVKFVVQSQKIKRKK